jgi:xylan 1,4-beta-xylosidase
MQRAAFVASASIYMQSAPIDRSNLYRGDTNFGVNGDSADKVGQALILLGTMRDTPVRLALTGDDQNGFAVQAGRSADGKTVQVLISNYEIPPFERGPRPQGDILHIPFLGDFPLMPRRSVQYNDNRGYVLDILHLPSGNYSVSRYRISSDVDIKLMRSEQRQPPLHIASDLTAPAIELIVARHVD